MKQIDKMENVEFEDELTQEFTDESTEEFVDPETQEFEQDNEIEEELTEEDDEQTQEMQEDDLQVMENAQIKMENKKMILSSQYTNSKNRTEAGTLVSYDQRSSQNVNIAVLMKQLLPYIAALIFIAIIVAGIFLYFDIGYQNTMEQIQQIIQRAS